MSDIARNSDRKKRMRSSEHAHQAGSSFRNGSTGYAQSAYGSNYQGIPVPSGTLALKNRARPPAVKLLVGPNPKSKRKKVLDYQQIAT